MFFRRCASPHIHTTTFKADKDLPNFATAPLAETAFLPFAGTYRNGSSVDISLHSKVNKLLFYSPRSSAMIEADSACVVKPAVLCFNKIPVREPLRLRGQADETPTHLRGTHEVRAFGDQEHVRVN